MLIINQVPIITGTLWLTYVVQLQTKLLHCKYFLCFCTRYLNRKCKLSLRFATGDPAAISHCPDLPRQQGLQRQQGPSRPFQPVQLEDRGRVHWRIQHPWSGLLCRYLPNGLTVLSNWIIWLQCLAVWPDWAISWCLDNFLQQKVVQYFSRNCPHFWAIFDKRSFFLCLTFQQSAENDILKIAYNRISDFWSEN